MDTAALNTGNKSGINKRFVDFYKHYYDHGVHSLEYQFYVNEIYFIQVIAKVKGKTKGPQTM